MTPQVIQGQAARSGLPEILLVAEAARIARVSPATIRSEVRSGRLLAIRVGSGKARAHVRVSLAALTAWLGRHDDSHGEAGRVTPASLI